MAVAVDMKLFSVSYFCFPKVLQARVLHDGLDGADPSVCLLSVPFDQVDGYPSPAVTPATGVGSAATPWTVQQIHITIYIFKSEFWYISDDVQLVKKKQLTSRLCWTQQAHQETEERCPHDDSSRTHVDSEEPEDTEHTSSAHYIC